MELFTQVIGSMESGMALAVRCGLMVVGMRATGGQIRPMDKES